MAEVCAGVISSLGMSKAIASICLWQCLSFQPEFKRQIVPGWGAVFHDLRCLESPLAAAVIKFDVTARDSVTAPRNPSHSALGALLPLLGSTGSGTRGTPLSWLSSSFSQFPSSAEFQGEHGGSSLLVRCGVLLTVPHRNISSNITDPKGTLDPWDLCVISILKPGIGWLKFHRFYSCICYWKFSLCHSSVLDADCWSNFDFLQFIVF